MFPRRYRALGAAVSLCLTFACGDDEPEPSALPSTLAECGSSLDVLLARPSDDSPELDASYTEALASWPFPDDTCGLGVFRGQCSDGKQLLYRNGGFTSEIRYFDGEQLVGVVASGDLGLCPSVCPFSEFYGDVDDVRCDAPTFEELCAGSSEILGEEPVLPFANGEPPGGCEAF